MQGGGCSTASKLPSEARTQDHAGRGQKERKSKGMGQEKGGGIDRQQGERVEKDTSPAAGDAMPPLCHVPLDSEP